MFFAQTNQFVGPAIVQWKWSIETRWYQSGLAVSGWLLSGKRVLINSSTMSMKFPRQFRGNVFCNSSTMSRKFLSLKPISLSVLQSFRGSGLSKQCRENLLDNFEEFFSQFLDYPPDSSQPEMAKPDWYQRVSIDYFHWTTAGPTNWLVWAKKNFLDIIEELRKKHFLKIVEELTLEEFPSWTRAPRFFLDLNSSDSKIYAPQLKPV